MQIDLAAERAEPTVVCGKPMAGQHAQFLGESKLFLWDARPSAAGSQTWMLDLRSCESEAWKSPQPETPGLEFRKLLEPGDICFSSDGRRITFAARIWDSKPDHAPATVIWTCAPDGADLKQVTPWDTALVPAASQ